MKGQRWFFIAVVAVVCGLGVSMAVYLGHDIAAGRSFYVDPLGDDKNDGRSPSRAWSSFAPLNATALRPGDRVFLQGGAEFTDTLRLTAEDGGDPDNPVVVSSRGPGRAVLKPTTGSAVEIRDTGGITVSDLTVIGTYQGRFDGISLFNVAPRHERARGITVANVDVSGFYQGISIGAASYTPGFSDVVVRDSEVHNNIAGGVATFGLNADVDNPVYAHSRITVSGVSAYDNPGDPSATTNTGNGIVVGSVDGARIENCTASGNGAKSTAREGPVGIWAHDANNVVIERNVSYRNLTSGVDGGGFDLDQGVTNSVMQYNLSYENASAGFLLFTNQARTGPTHNVVRFNVSVGDVQAGGYYGSLTILGGLVGSETPGGIRGVEVYNNTIISAVGGQNPTNPQLAPVVRVGGTLDDVLLANNVFISRDGGPLVQATDARLAGITLAGNAYSAPAGKFVVQWGGQLLTSLASLRTETGQELVRGRAVGLEQRVIVEDAHVPANVRSAEDRINAVGAKLAARSPLLSGGVDLHAEFGIDIGPLDFYGVRLRDEPDIGAACCTSG